MAAQLLCRVVLLGRLFLKSPHRHTRSYLPAECDVEEQHGQHADDEGGELFPVIRGQAARKLVYAQRQRFESRFAHQDVDQRKFVPENRNVQYRQSHGDRLRHAYDDRAENLEIACSVDLGGFDDRTGNAPDILGAHVDADR